MQPNGVKLLWVDKICPCDQGLPNPTIEKNCPQLTKWLRVKTQPLPLTITSNPRRWKKFMGPKFWNYSSKWVSNWLGSFALFKWRERERESTWGTMLFSLGTTFLRNLFTRWRSYCEIVSSIFFENFVHWNISYLNYCSWFPSMFPRQCCCEMWVQNFWELPHGTLFPGERFLVPMQTPPPLV